MGGERHRSSNSEILKLQYTSEAPSELVRADCCCPYPKFPNWGGPENLHLSKFVGNADIVGPKPYFEHYLSIGLMFNKTLR